MAEGDFEARLKKVIKFLERGDKVRLDLLFKGRAITKKEFGFELFDKIFERTAEIATVEIRPKLMGRKLMAQLSPTGKKK
jgi:translation initiation factor IF-3